MSGNDATDLSGRVAIVTGAGAGLGRSEALAMAARGARLVINDVATEPAAAVVDEIKAGGGQAVAHAGDVGEWSTGEALLATALDSFGQLDILVNNAGILRDRMLFNMAEDEWDAVLRVHLKGHFVNSRIAANHWREESKRTGEPVYARIINTASEAFLFGSPGQPNYASAKAGIAALTLSTAFGCGKFGVRANAICPRARTGMTEGVFASAPEGAPDPMSTENVAPVVAWLAAPASDKVTGQVFVVHSGKIALISAPAIAGVVEADPGGWTPERLAEIGPLAAAQPGGYAAVALRDFG